MTRRRPVRRMLDVLLLLALLAAIVLPFVLFEAEMLAAVAWIRDSAWGGAAVASALVGLLVLDVFAPVPSSLVGVALGAGFGGLGGTLLCWLGLTAGALVGYGAGRRLGRPLIRATVGGADLAALEGLAARHGAWALALLRAVPVLAEASVILAGAGALRLPAFAAVVVLSNFGIALVYAWIGSLGVATGTMWLALAAAIGVPGLAWAALRLVRGASGRRAGVARDG